MSITITFHGHATFSLDINGTKVVVDPFFAGNSPVTWIPRLVGTKSILNVDGLDWKREKWPEIAKKLQNARQNLTGVLPF